MEFLIGRINIIAVCLQLKELIEIYLSCTVFFFSFFYKIFAL